MNIVKLIDFPVRGDARGSLVAVEQFSNVPFAIKRVYYLYGTLNGVSRGFHAHIALTQVAVCVSGSCRMLLDDGTVREDILLDNPSKGIVIEPMMWHEMHDFSPDCVLLVLASDHYDESDYIRDYERFKEELK